MKITFEDHGMRYTVECERQDFDAVELKEIFSRLLVLAQYPPSVIEDSGDSGCWSWVG